jgi:DNA-binding NarL/FixJ family response regulator
MLWLDQFPEFNVLGTTVDTGSLSKQIEDVQPDVVLLDIGTPGAEDIAALREIKDADCSPAVVLLHQGEPGEVRGVLANESDGQIPIAFALSHLPEAIRKVANKRRVAISAANMPMTKAG